MLILYFAFSMIFLIIMLAAQKSYDGKVTYSDFALCVICSHVPGLNIFCAVYMTYLVLEKTGFWDRKMF